MDSVRLPGGYSGRRSAGQLLSVDRRPLRVPASKSGARSRLRHRRRYPLPYRPPVDGRLSPCRPRGPADVSTMPRGSGSSALQIRNRRAARRRGRAGHPLPRRVRPLLRRLRRGRRLLRDQRLPDHLDPGRRPRRRALLDRPVLRAPRAQDPAGALLRAPLHDGARLGVDGALPARHYSRALVAVVLFVSNVHFWRAEDYFAPAAELNPLLHTWSLAVEEQFYIVFPIFLLRALAARQRPVLRAIGALSLGSLRLAEWGWRNEPAASFFLLPDARLGTRGRRRSAPWSCANGPARERPLLAGLGLGLICSRSSPSTTRPVPVALRAWPRSRGTALVILFARAGSPVARLLSLPPMVGLGLVSYSAYLWHQPLFALARVRSAAQPSPELMLGARAGDVRPGLSQLAVRRAAVPPSRPRCSPPRPAVFAASGVAAAAFLGVGAYGQATAGRFDAWMAANPEQAGVYGMVMAADADGRRLPRRRRLPVQRAKARRRHARAAARLPQPHGPGIAVLGDSHGVDFFNGMDAAYEGEFVFAMTFASCWMGNRSRNCDFEAFARCLRDQPGALRARRSSIRPASASLRRPRFPPGASFSSGSRNTPRCGRASSASSRPAPRTGSPTSPEIGKLAPLVWVGPRMEPHIGLNYMLERLRLRLPAAPGLAELFTDLDRRLAGGRGRRGRALCLADRRDRLGHGDRLHHLRSALLARRRPLESRGGEALRRPASRAGPARPARRGGRRPPPPVG